MLIELACACRPVALLPQAWPGSAALPLLQRLVQLPNERLESDWQNINAHLLPCLFSFETSLFLAALIKVSAGLRRARALAF